MNECLVNICTRPKRRHGYCDTHSKQYEKYGKIVYEKINQRCKYQFNENIFDKLDSDQKVYWLGFLLGDGHIRKNRCNNPGSLVVELELKDKHHLNKFIKYIKYTGRIRTQIRYRDPKKYKRAIQKSVILALHSVYMCKILKELGWFGFKEKGDLTILKKIPHKYLSSFLLGWFDADGSVIVNKKGQLMFSVINLHEPNTKWYRNQLVREVSIKPIKIYKPNKAYVFTYEGNRQVKRIFEYLYKTINCPKLERKYKIYEKISKKDIS